MPTPLCTNCKAIQINDSNPALSAIPTTHPTHHHPILKIGNNNNPAISQTRLPIAHRWRDTLPSLPSLHTSAQQTGCPFCHFLRRCILARNLPFQGAITVRMWYLWESHVQDELGALCVLVEGEGEGSVPGMGADARAGFEVAVEAGAPNPAATWLQIRPAPMDDALCEENVKMMKAGIERCIGGCHPRLGVRYVPTRLIYIGEVEERGAARLVLTDHLNMSCRADLEYAALSYCWGPPEEARLQLKTEIATLSDRLGGIPIDTLTKVVQDAIKVTRALGIHYLWVDCLCIVQDDGDDWAKESAEMGRVYLNSYVTICAVASSSCLQGFLDRDPIKVEIGFQSTLDKSISGTYTLRFDSKGGDVYNDDSDWAMRGWTFQEDELSVRKIIFRSRNFEFLCPDRLYTENEPGYQTPTPPMAGYLSKSRTGQVASEEWYHKWRYTIVNYTFRNLTFTKDRLPAISGLAKYIAESTRDVYHAGVWEGDLLKQLLWACQTVNPAYQGLDKHLMYLASPENYVAPSWSWANQNQYIKFGHSLYPIYPETALQPEYTWIDVCTQLDGPNPFGRVKSATLEITGRICPLPADLTAIQRFRYSAHKWEIKVAGRYVSNFQLDWESAEIDIQPRGELVALLLASETEARERDAEGLVEGSPGAGEHRSVHAWGMILHPTLDRTAYHRVGMFVSRAVEDGGMDWFEGVSLQTVTII